MAICKIDNLHIYYEVHGQGKPLLLLNGIMMSTKSWTPFIEPFSYQNQLILIDMLDQGQSSKLINQQYSQAIQVAAIKQVLTCLKLDKISIVGISYGGEVALQFATRYPELVERLILLNTSAYTSPQLLDVGRAWNKAALSGDGQAYYYTTIPVIYSPAFYQRKLDWLKKREQVLVPVFSDHNFTDAMVRLTLSAESHDVRDKLKDITMPTLIVSSDQDFLTPVSDQVYLAKHIPNASHVLIQNTGHASMYEQPLVFASLILGFINVTKTDYTI